MSRVFGILPLLPLFALGAVGALGGCGATGDEQVTAPTPDAGPDVSITLPDTAGADTAPVIVDAPFDACVSQTVAAKQVGLAMLVLIDHSGSMLELEKWNSASKAIRGFVDRKEAIGLDVGLTFFPPLSASAEICTYTTYSTPAVPMAALPSNVLPIQRALLEAGSPTGGTPMEPALRGALSSVRDFVSSKPDTEGVVVLVTDGDPSACGTIDQVAAQAKEAVTVTGSAKKIRTFVVGMDGATFSNLDKVAAAGESAKSFNVGSGYAASDALLKAFEDIRVGALGCEYLLSTPDPKYRIEYDRVSVSFTPEPGSPTQSIGRVVDRSACTETVGGFYYDSNDKPTRIKLCDTTCKVVQAARRDTAKLDINLGCLKVVM